MITEKFLIYILFLLTMFSCTNRNENDAQISKAKETVQEVFRLSSKDNFDSLRILIPLINKESDDYLRISFAGIKEIFLEEGLPNSENLQSRKFPSSDVNIYIIKYIPKAVNKLGIDSLLFTFDKYNGLNKIATFEVFEQVRELKPILPPGK